MVGVAGRVLSGCQGGVSLSAEEGVNASASINRRQACGGPTVSATHLSLASRGNSRQARETAIPCLSPVPSFGLFLSFFFKTVKSSYFPGCDLLACQVIVLGAGNSGACCVPCMCDVKRASLTLFVDYVFVCL